MSKRNLLPSKHDKHDLKYSSEEMLFELDTHTTGKVSVSCNILLKRRWHGFQIAMINNSLRGTNQVN